MQAIGGQETSQLVSFPQTKSLLWARTGAAKSILCSVEREVWVGAKYGVEKGGDAPED